MSGHKHATERKFAKRATMERSLAAQHRAASEIRHAAQPHPKIRLSRFASRDFASPPPVVCGPQSENLFASGAVVVSGAPVTQTASADGSDARTRNATKQPAQAMADLLS